MTRKRAFGTVALLSLSLALAACSARSSGDPLADAQKHFDAGDLAAARVELLNAAKQQPDSVAVAMLRAKTFMELGDGAGVEAAIADARRLGAKDDLVAYEVEAALLQNDADKAIRLLNDNVPPAGQAANRERLRGEAQVARGDLPAGIATLQAADALDPEDARIQIALGNALLLTANPDAADVHAKRAQALDAKRLGTQLLSARIATWRHDAKAALPYFENALALRADNPAALFGKAMMLGELGRIKEMEPLLDKGLTQYPGNPQGLYLKARLIAGRGEYKEAQELLQRAGDGFDSDAVVLAFAAEVATKLGYHSTAIDRLEKASRLRPTVTHLRYLLAEAQFANGQADAARATLRVFDAIQPTPVEVAALKKKMGMTVAMR